MCYLVVMLSALFSEAEVKIHSTNPCSDAGLWYGVIKRGPTWLFQYNKLSIATVSFRRCRIPTVIQNHFNCFLPVCPSGHHQCDRSSRGAHQNAQGPHFCAGQNRHAVRSERHQEVEDGLWYQRALGEPADGLGLNVRPPIPHCSYTARNQPQRVF